MLLRSLSSLSIPTIEGGVYNEGASCGVTRVKCYKNAYAELVFDPLPCSEVRFLVEGGHESPMMKMAGKLMPLSSLPSPASSSLLQSILRVNPFPLRPEAVQLHPSEFSTTQSLNAKPLLIFPEPTHDDVDCCPQCCRTSTAKLSNKQLLR